MKSVGLSVHLWVVHGERPTSETPKALAVVDHCESSPDLEPCAATTEDDWQVAIEDALARSERGESVDLGELIEPLAEMERTHVASFCRARLDSLPVPIGARASGPAVRRRRALERGIAWVDALRGEPNELLRLMRIKWLRGAPHLTYLNALIRFGRKNDACVLARSLLDDPTCEQRPALEKMLARVSRAPDGWDEAVELFVREPSADGWHELFRFVPPHTVEERTRHTIRLMQGLGVSGDVIFRYASLTGALADLVSVIESGEVDPAAVIARSADSAAPAIWLGLAARAACTRGDDFLCVRLLREALSTTPKQELLVPDVMFVWDHASDALTTLLESAKIPRRLF